MTLLQNVTENYKVVSNLKSITTGTDDEKFHKLQIEIERLRNLWKLEKNEEERIIIQLQEEIRTLKRVNQ